MKHQWIFSFYSLSRSIASSLPPSASVRRECGRGKGGRSLSLWHAFSPSLGSFAESHRWPWAAESGDGVLWGGGRNLGVSYCVWFDLFGLCEFWCCSKGSEVEIGSESNLVLIILTLFDEHFSLTFFLSTLSFSFTLYTSTLGPTSFSQYSPLPHFGWIVFGNQIFDFFNDIFTFPSPLQTPLLHWPLVPLNCGILFWHSTTVTFSTSLSGLHWASRGNPCRVTNKILLFVISQGLFQHSLSF